jgi:hypothetical protein
MPLQGIVAVDLTAQSGAHAAYGAPPPTLLAVAPAPTVGLSTTLEPLVRRNVPVSDEVFCDVTLRARVPFK